MRLSGQQNIIVHLKCGCQFTAPNATPRLAHSWTWSSAVSLQAMRTWATACSCRAWDWLAENPKDAAELATMLIETAPSLAISRDSSISSGRTSSGRLVSRRTLSQQRPVSSRLTAAQLLPIGGLRESSLCRLVPVQDPIESGLWTAGPETCLGCMPCSTGYDRTLSQQQPVCTRLTAAQLLRMGRLNSKSAPAHAHAGQAWP